jgi:hypothetical protein
MPSQTLSVIANSSARNTVTETTLQDKVNELLDHVVYLQIIGSFVPNADFKQIKEIVISTHNFIKNSSDEEVEAKQPELRGIVTKMTSLFMAKQITSFCGNAKSFMTLAEKS